MSRAYFKNSYTCFPFLFYFHGLEPYVAVVGMGATRGASYHYFDGLGSRASGNDVHSWSAEDALVRALARSGHLTLLTPEGCVASRAGMCRGLGGGGEASW